MHFTGLARNKVSEKNENTKFSYLKVWKNLNNAVHKKANT